MLFGIPAPVRDNVVKAVETVEGDIVCNTLCNRWSLEVTSIALTLLDLSSAFDIVDHTLLLSILQNRFPVTGLSQEWFHFYLTNRT